MVKCPNCSGENADTQHFCGECGTPLTADVPRTLSYPETTKPAADNLTRLAPGALFASRYQVIEELGTGGMGSVYRVLDRTLSQEVALKLIRPEIANDSETVERFKTELKLAREVVHKNVAQMFDFNEVEGTPFITMQYVRGENLKQLLKKVGHLFAGQAIPYACEICEGLAEAHRLQIVHRDLKPQNIMIDEDGQARIMDFGLARLAEAEGAAQKRSGDGTPAYMSPEQVRGDPSDGRTDIYSLGVLLFEMLTGELPFKASSRQELRQKHLSEPPPDPRQLNHGISAELSQVVLRCLAKDPAGRFQTVAEVQKALDCLRQPVPHGAPIEAHPPRRRRWARIAGPAALAALLVYLFFIPPHPPPFRTSTIAILRPSDVSPGPSSSNFGQEIQDAVATKLSGLSDLSVVPLQDVNAAETSGKGSKAIGRLLHADYLLQLNFKFDKPTLYLNAELVDAAQGRRARTYELSRDIADISPAKDEFARDIATILRDDIVEDRLQKTNKGVSSNLDARLLYHEGMRLVEDVFGAEKTGQVIEAAIAKYRQALALDPDYALALWAMGNAYEARYNNTPWEVRDPADIDRMWACYQEAFAKNPNSSETNIGLGWAHFNKSDFTRALGFFRSAIKLEPKNPIVCMDVGAFLRSIGLFERAIRYLSRAARLSPYDRDPLIQQSICLMSLGRYGDAAEKAEEALRLEPNDINALYYRAVQLILAGRLEEAGKEVKAVADLDAEKRYKPMLDALLAASRGDKAEALALRPDIESLSLPGTCFYLLLGMNDEAIANIENGIEKGFKLKGEYLYSYPCLVKNPSFKTLRGSPRFEDILKKQKAQYLKELKAFERL